MRKHGRNLAQVLLVDNGSRKAEATLVLRALAEGLSARCGCKVDAVSLRHADNIPPNELNGKPAWIFRDYLKSQLQAGQQDFIVLPLFFGLSRAISSFIPEQTKILESELGAFNLEVADVLYPLPQGEKLLVEILHDHIVSAASTCHHEVKNVVLVDHGSPTPRITQVRQHIATALTTWLGNEKELDQAVMERREGAEYDFNGPLLQDRLVQMAQSGKKGAIVCMMFLLPGRHAGTSGDIVQICDQVRKEFPGFEICISPLVSESPKLLSLLQNRLTKYL